MWARPSEQHDPPVASSKATLRGLTHLRSKTPPNRRRSRSPNKGHPHTPRRSRRRSRWAFHAAMAVVSGGRWWRAPAAAGGTGPMGPRRRRWSSPCARSLLRADLRFGGGERHRLEAAPGPAPADRLGLEEPDHGLGRRGVERAPRPAPPDLRPPTCAHAGRDAGLGEALRVPDGAVPAAPRPSARPAPRARRGPARVGGLLERAQPEARGGAAARPPGPRCAARRRRSQRPCGQSPAGPPRGACPRGGGGEVADPPPVRRGRGQRAPRAVRRARCGRVPDRRPHGPPARPAPRAAPWPASAAPPCEPGEPGGRDPRALEPPPEPGSGSGAGPFRAPREPESPPRGPPRARARSRGAARAGSRRRAGGRGAPAGRSAAAGRPVRPDPIGASARPRRTREDRR